MTLNEEIIGNLLEQINELKETNKYLRDMPIVAKSKDDFLHRHIITSARLIKFLNRNPEISPGFLLENEGWYSIEIRKYNGERKV